MSRVGNPYDNAKAESFIKTLKREEVYGRKWRDLDALRAELTTVFQITYNHERLHSALNHQTPAAFKQQLPSLANDLELTLFCRLAQVEQLSFRVLVEGADAGVQDNSFHGRSSTPGPRCSSSVLRRCRAS